MVAFLDLNLSTDQSLTNSSDISYDTVSIRTADLGSHVWWCLLLLQSPVVVGLDLFILRVLSAVGRLSINLGEALLQRAWLPFSVIFCMLAKRPDHSLVRCDRILGEQLSAKKVLKVDEKY